MSEVLDQLNEVRLQRTIAALEKNQFKVSLFNDEIELRAFLNLELKNKVSVSVGGSMTLTETGVIDLLEKHPDITYLDRYHSDNPDEIYHQALSCDTYITSSNAVTMQGELYNIDGTGNRVAAMIYGPTHVLVIVGVNKIVQDMEAAEARLSNLAAPANCIRLKKENPCTKLGYCANCQLPTRICSNYVKIARCSKPERIHVILLRKVFGY